MIELRINADTPEELIRTINGLASLGGGAKAAPASVLKDPDVVEMLEERTADPQPEAPKQRRRRTETAGAPAAETAQDTPASATPASTASRAETTGLTGDQLSQQIRQANDEAAAERAGDEPITFETVHAAFAKACAPGGKFTMVQAQNLLKDSFVTAAGDPVRRIMELQPQDYPAALAKLEG